MGQVLGNPDELPPTVGRLLAQVPLSGGDPGRPEGVIELVTTAERGHGQDPGGLQQHDAHQDKQTTANGEAHSSESVSVCS